MTPDPSDPHFDRAGRVRMFGDFWRSNPPAGVGCYDPGPYVKIPDDAYAQPAELAPGPFDNTTSAGQADAVDAVLPPAPPSFDELLAARPTAAPPGRRSSLLTMALILATGAATFRGIERATPAPVIACRPPKRRRRGNKYALCHCGSFRPAASCHCGEVREAA